MTETEATDETPQAPPAPESGGVGLGPGLFVLMVLGLPLMVLAQTAFGLWEPWETSWAELAREMRQSGQWFAPSLGEKVVPRALLPIWLTAAGQALLGESEWGMRLPMALCVMAGLGALFVWLREVFGGWRALVAALAALTSPLIFFSGATLAGNGAFVGATMAAVACMGLVLGRKAAPSLPLMGGLGLSLAACALSWGLWGLWLPLGIAIGAGLSARGLAEAGWQWSKVDGIALGLGGAITGGLLAWCGTQDWDTATLQWIGLALPPVWLACGAAMAWSTRTAALFKGLGAALVLGPPLVAVAVCATFYAGAAPAETLAGDVPALTFLLENHLVTPRALPEHVTFDFWVRQIGFSAWPWTALLPLGLVYVLRRDTGALTEAEAIASRAAIDPAKTREDAPEHAMRLILAWFVVSMLAALLLGTVHERYLFPAVAPIGLAVALALTDRAFWSALQDKPLLARALGLAVIFTALFLTKDLERYPQQLLGPLLTDGKFEAPEDFALGSAIKALRYGLALALLGYFMDAFSWPRRLWRWWMGRKTPTTDQTEPEAPSEEESDDTQGDAIGQQASRLAEEAPGAQKEGVPGWMAALHARTRTPDGLAVALVVCGVIFLGLAGMRWVPELSHHLSQKGLLEAYEAKAAPGEPLLTYQVSTHNASYYFSGLERLTSMAALKTKWGGDARVFVVLPNDRLSSLNYEIRKGTEPKRNIHVLDNRSSRYVLASNMLGEGEQERSAVAQAILPERPRPIYQITPKNTAGERVYGQFDKKIQLIGYEVYHEGEVDEWGNPTEEARAKLRARKTAGKPTVFKAGQKMVIRYFFKVLKRVTSSQKIFLHVDYPGTRINGDHVPVDEQFPTNHWLPGDYVVDTQRLDIEAGSPSGAYTMYMGFFLGSRRMEVTPKSGHDGSNRVKLGTIEVQSF